MEKPSDAVRASKRPSIHSRRTGHLTELFFTRGIFSPSTIATGSSLHSTDHGIVHHCRRPDSTFRSCPCVTDVFWPTTKFLQMVLPVMIRRTEPQPRTDQRD